MVVINADIQRSLLMIKSISMLIYFPDDLYNPVQNILRKVNKSRIASQDRELLVPVFYVFFEH